MRKYLAGLNASIRDDVTVEIDQESATLGFEIVGQNKVDIAFHLEELTRLQKLSLLGSLADTTTSRFSHRLLNDDEAAVANVLALEQREMMSQLEPTTIYQTPTLIFVAGAAFVVSGFLCVVMFYRRKVKKKNCFFDPISSFFFYF